MAVFIQTWVLSPHPVALLAPHAFLLVSCFCLHTTLQFCILQPAVCGSNEKNVFWTPVVAAIPPFFSANPRSWQWADGVPYPPSLLTFPSQSALQDFRFAVNPVNSVRCLLLNQITRHALFLALFSRQGSALGAGC